MNEVNPSAEPQVIEKKRPYSRLAIASLIVGLSSFVFMVLWQRTHPNWFVGVGVGGILLAVVTAGELAYTNRRGWGCVIVGGVLCALALYCLAPFQRVCALADMVKCANQLHETGLAIKAYQADYDGHNPPTLETLVELGMIEPKLLICPRLLHPTEACSYIYRGYDLTDKADEEMILVYDKAGNHDYDVFLVLYADYHVKYQDYLWDDFDRDNQLRREQGFAEKPMEITPRFDREGKEIITEPKAQD